MSESFASSAQPNNSSYPEVYSNSNTNDNHHHRKQKHRPIQTSSQDVRYNHHTHQQQQQQQQQQWYPQQMYYDEYYYQQPTARGGYSTRNHHQYQQQQRRPQYRQPSASSQINQQVTVRPNSNLSTRSTTETENLRSTLTEQLFENAYECMICIIKIEYVVNFDINRHMYIIFFILLVVIKKFGHVIFVINYFIYFVFDNGLIVKKVV